MIEKRRHADFPDYIVCSDGAVISERQPRPRVMSPIKMGKYRGLQLKNSANVLRRVYVHRLVCETFHGKCQPGYEARHLDGDRTNNASSNLKWGTRAENEQDKVRHGTLLVGERHPGAKLSDSAVQEMRKLRRDGWSLPDLEARFSVSRMTVWRAVKGVSWSHVEGVR